MQAAEERKLVGYCCIHRHTGAYLLYSVVVDRGCLFGLARSGTEMLFISVIFVIKPVLASWKCWESSCKGRLPCPPVSHAHRPGYTTCRGQGVSGFSLPLASALQAVAALAASCFHACSWVFGKSPNELRGRPFCAEEPSASIPLHFSLQMSFS